MARAAGLEAFNVATRAGDALTAIGAFSASRTCGVMVVSFSVWRLARSAGLMGWVGADGFYLGDNYCFSISAYCFSMKFEKGHRKQGFALALFAPQQRWSPNIPVFTGIGDEFGPYTRR